MDTQNTPVHIRLWHADFWLLAIINLLITMSIDMLIPVLPVWMLSSAGMNTVETGIMMGAYGLGLFVLGGFCNFWVQRYRRNRVCLWAMFFVFLSLVGTWGVQKYLSFSGLQFPLLLFCRVV